MVEFLRAVNRFSSNYAPLFGHLLSPLVDGIRVAGPFEPTWLAGSSARKVVLLDGEGLGHTPKSATSLPTAVAKAINDVDAVLLVDNATQPAQAAPASAIRSILTSGNTDKLIFCFTHFDRVIGDNLATPRTAPHTCSRRSRTCCPPSGSSSGPFRASAAPSPRNRLLLLVGHRQTPGPRDGAGQRSIAQFHKLLDSIDKIVETPEPVIARPVYDKTNLVLAITAAAASFHRAWRARLGITTEADISKEHWSRVKALNRRFAEGKGDQYDTLRPSADLRELLKEDIYKTLERPCTGRRCTHRS